MITTFVPEGETVVISLSDDMNPKEIPVSWALLTYEDTTEMSKDIGEKQPQVGVLWMIRTRENFRRQGHATYLLKELQKIFDKIITQCDIISANGTKLCLKNNFELKKSSQRNKPDDLIWEKK